MRVLPFGNRRPSPIGALFLFTSLFVVGCGGDDEFIASVSRIEISGPYDLLFQLPIDRPTVGIRAGMIVVAYNQAGVTLDPFISGVEVYEAIKWKTSDESIVEVEVSPLLNTALIRFKRPGRAVITAILNGLSDSMLLTVE